MRLWTWRSSSSAPLTRPDVSVTLIRMNEAKAALWRTLAKGEREKEAKGSCRSQAANDLRMKIEAQTFAPMVDVHRKAAEAYEHDLREAGLSI